MKTRLSLGSHLSVAGGVSNAVAGAIDLKLGALQIFTKNANRWKQKALDPKEITRFKEKRAEWGPFAAGSHDSYLINMGSPDDALWEKSVVAFIDELERAEQLDLDFVVTHPGAHVGSGVEPAIERLVKGMHRVLESVPHGTTRILLENTAGQGTTLGRSFEELAAMLHGIDAPERVGVCLDTCHLYAAGYDIRTRAGYDATMAQLEAAVGADQVRLWHLNDSKGKLGSHLDRHEHIGQGEIGETGFQCVVQDPRFFGVPKILETPKEDDMDPVNLATLWSLATH
ncbi:MAG: deoxyribonuclease IV [Planctomycetota bacterium]